jgi:hypothetical protein
MEEHFTPDVDELASTRVMLNSRYNDLKSGRVKPIGAAEVKARLSERAALPPRRG